MRDMFDIPKPPADLPAAVVKVGDMVCTHSVGMEGARARASAAIGKVMAINPDGTAEVELSPVLADEAIGTMDDNDAEAIYERLGLPNKLQSLPKQRVRIPVSQVSPWTDDTNTNDGEGRNNGDVNQAGGGAPLPLRSSSSLSNKSSKKLAIDELETWVVSQDNQLSTQRRRQSGAYGRLTPLPVIVVNGLPVSFAKLYRDKTESTSDPQVMLKRMLVRQVFGSEAYARSSTLFHVLDDLKPADVYLQLIDASLLLDWAFVTTVTFFPGGQALSYQEINECHRRLDRFWKQKEARWAVKKLRLNFAAFSQWFIVTTNELMQDRVGFVQSVTIDDLDIFEQQIDATRALAVSQRDNNVRSMVARADEVNKHVSERKLKRYRSEKTQSSISGKSDVSDLNTSTHGSPNANGTAARFHPSDRFNPMLPMIDSVSEEQKTTPTSSHRRLDASSTVAGDTTLLPSIALTMNASSSSSPEPVPVPAGTVEERCTCTCCCHLNYIMQTNPNRSPNPEPNPTPAWLSPYPNFTRRVLHESIHECDTVRWSKQGHRPPHRSDFLHFGEQ